MSKSRGQNMRNAAILLILPVILSLSCQRGSIKVSPVIEGVSAPHAGYNIGPDLWLEPGDKVKVTGAVIWIEGLEPNEIF